MPGHLYVCPGRCHRRGPSPAAGGPGGRVTAAPCSGRVFPPPCPHPRLRRDHTGSVASPDTPMQRERGGQSPGAPETEIKAVIVGDGGCGKTSLLVAFARGDFPKVPGPLSPEGRRVIFPVRER